MNSFFKAGQDAKEPRNRSIVALILFPGIEDTSFPTDELKVIHEYR